MQAFSAALNTWAKSEISVLDKGCILRGEGGSIRHLFLTLANLSWEQENTEEQVRGGNGAYEVGQAEVAVVEPPVPLIFASFHLLIYHTPMSPHL